LIFKTPASVILFIVGVFLHTAEERFVAQTPLEVFKKTLSFRQYRFEVATNATGPVRELAVQVFFNSSSLVTIRQKTDGYVLNAEVADLDRNGSPEIYLYSTTYGSGSFGKLYAFQFFPDSFDAIRLESLTAAQEMGYMGHDDFKVENGFLTRRFPVYNPGDANAQPTGGTRTLRYELKEIAGKLVLVSKK
jgi:hypothetical protein